MRGDHARRGALGLVVTLAALGAIWLLGLLLAWSQIGSLGLGLVVLAGLVLALYQAIRRRRFGWPASIGLGVLGAVWILSLTAIVSDWHDADGFTDCYPSCTAVQTGVAVTFFLIPGASALVVLTFLGAGLWRRREPRAHQLERR